MMAKKKVEMSTVKLEVATVPTAPEFSVTDDGKVFGDLRVSRGGVFWRQKNAKQYLHLTWEQVDELFKQHGTLRAVGQYNFSPPPAGSFDEF